MRNQLVFIYITHDDMKNNGFDSYRQDFPELGYTKDGFYYRTNHIWVPNYMIKNTISVERARRQYPELFL